MIRVKKRRAVPAALQTPEVKAAQRDLKARFNAQPLACRVPGNKLLYVPATLYNSAAVKQQLIADQHEKCCYCEAYLQHVGYGDVEHYRPKNGFRQRRGAALEKPGYYWLAYTWKNLLFSCQRCNSGHKGNIFPLVNHPVGRARSHREALAQEQPLLLHPATDDPAPHITFRRAVAVGQTPHGQTTIDVCGLNRGEVLERRRTHLAHLESHDAMADQDPTRMAPADLRRAIAKCGSVQEFVRRVIQAKDIRQKAALDTSEYAGMVRANFPLLPQR